MALSVSIDPLDSGSEEPEVRDNDERANGATGDTGDSEDPIGEPIGVLEHKARILIAAGLDRNSGQGSYVYTDRGNSIAGLGVVLRDASKAANVLPRLEVPFTTAHSNGPRYGAITSLTVQGRDIDPILLEADRIKGAITDPDKK